MPSRPDPLPVEARRLLWERVWAKLLAPLPEEEGDQEQKEAAGVTPTRAPGREGA
jgi:hypothetical protein